MAWTENEIRFLKKHYSEKGKMWCAERLGKREGQVRMKASRMGIKLNRHSEFYEEARKRAGLKLKGRKRPEHSKLMKEYIAAGRLPHIFNKTPETLRKMSIGKRESIKRLGHPRGFLGHQHADKAKMEISKKAKRMWSDPGAVVNSDEHRQKCSDAMFLNVHSGKINKINIYSRGWSGWWENGEKRYFMRSKWEYNYAWYLDFLKRHNEILDWEYEADTFWFLEIKRGVRSYTPDFKIYTKNDGVEYHEVKGYMDAKSKTKLARMKKYYPSVKLVVIDKERYREIMKSRRLFLKTRSTHG